MNRSADWITEAPWFIEPVTCMVITSRGKQTVAKWSGTQWISAFTGDPVPYRVVKFKPLEYAQKQTEKEKEAKTGFCETTCAGGF